MHRLNQFWNYSLSYEQSSFTRVPESRLLSLGQSSRDIYCTLDNTEKNVEVVTSFSTLDTAAQVTKIQMYFNAMFGRNVNALQNQNK